MIRKTSHSLGKIRISVDEDLIEMVPNYVQRRKDEFSNISRLASSGDFATIQTIGHKLKGNAALFGLDELGYKGAELEKAAIASNQSLVEELALDMTHYLEQVEFEPNSENSTT